MVSHKNHLSPSLQYVCAVSSSIVCFPAKRHESWNHVILLLGFALGVDRKESTETHSDLNGSQQQQ
jgi:hypothetical protein